MLGLVTADVAAPLDPDLLPLDAAMRARLGDDAVAIVSWDDATVDWSAFCGGDHPLALGLHRTSSTSSLRGSHRVDASTTLVNAADGREVEYRQAVPRRPRRTKGSRSRRRCSWPPGEVPPGRGSSRRQADGRCRLEWRPTMRTRRGGRPRRPAAHSGREPRWCSPTSTCSTNGARRRSASSPGTGDGASSSATPSARVRSSPRPRSSRRVISSRRRRSPARVPSAAELALAERTLSTDVVRSLGDIVFARVDVAPSPRSVRQRIVRRHGTRTDRAVVLLRHRSARRSICSPTDSLVAALQRHRRTARGRSLTWPVVAASG